MKYADSQFKNVLIMEMICTFYKSKDANVYICRLYCE